MAEQNVQYLLHKIDWEGWPDALEWLVKDDFGNEELNQLIYDATQTYNILEGYRTQIESLAESLIPEAEPGWPPQDS